jgi:hypothetical protein
VVAHVAECGVFEQLRKNDLGTQVVDGSVCGGVPVGVRCRVGGVSGQGEERGKQQGAVHGYAEWGRNA